MRGAELQVLTELKKDERVLGGASVLASGSSRETIYLKERRPFSPTCMMGDSVPLRVPAAREDARPTWECGSSSGLCSTDNVEEPH
jgi:hypothetical protein